MTTKLEVGGAFHSRLQRRTYGRILSCTNSCTDRAREKERAREGKKSRQKEGEREMFILLHYLVQGAHTQLFTYISSNNKYLILS